MITTPDGLALAKRVRDHLTAFPELHDQLLFWRRTVCGTTACIAGWVAVLDGAELNVDQHVDGGVSAVGLVTGEEIDDYAARALGLDDAEADRLFYALTENVDALAYLDELIAEAEAASEDSVATEVHA